MANFSYYPVDISDVWTFTRNLPLNNSFTLESAGVLIDKAQQIIVSNCKPLFGIELYDFGNEEEKKYYVRQVQNYNSANTIEKFRLDYFMNGTNCYDYNSAIILHYTDLDFHYWFALKLSQYEKNISEIYGFLEFHFKSDFEFNKENYRLFLLPITKQYSVDLLSDAVIETVLNWLDNTSNFNYRSRDKGSNKVSNQKTFLLTNRYRNVNLQKFSFFLKNLKSLELVDQTIPVNNFMAIFTGKNYFAENAVRWTGTNKELQYFVKILQQQKKIEILKNDIWLVTINCFLQSDGNRFTVDQLRTANGKLQKKEAIDEIVSKF